MYRRLQTPLILLVISGVHPVFAQPPTEPANVETPLQVSLAKETTVITEPLRPDGYPDYVAAMNKLASAGVLPENNASVLFWKAIGPTPLPQTIRARFWQMLGVAPLSDQGDYFVDIETFADKHAELWPAAIDKAKVGADDIHELVKRQFAQTISRPWTEREFPLVAAWLAANVTPLKLVSDGALLPHRYEPLLCNSEPETLMWVLFTGSQQTRNIARAFVCRAMLKLGNGHVDESWKDLLTVHRIGDLVGQSPLLIDSLICIAIHGTAFDGGQSFFGNARLDAKQLVQIRNDLRMVAIRPNVGRAIDLGERWSFLDIVCQAGRDQNPSFIRTLTTDEASSNIHTFLNLLIAHRVNWDTPLKIGNLWHDKLVKVLENRDPQERNKAIAGYDEELKALAKAVKERLAKDMLVGSRQQVSEAIGNITVCLMFPVLSAVSHAADRCQMRQQIADLSIALLLYKLDHAQYPSKLSELVPKYMNKVPVDLFGGLDLHYKFDDHGFLIYSVGDNGMDDLGRTSADADAQSETAQEQESEETPDWDDLSARIPADWQSK